MITELNDTLFLVLVMVCVATVIVNGILTWLNFKVYTEFFKERAISNRKEANK